MRCPTESFSIKNAVFNRYKNFDFQFFQKIWLQHCISPNKKKQLWLIIKLLIFRYSESTEQKWPFAFLVIHGIGLHLNGCIFVSNKLLHIFIEFYCGYTLSNAYMYATHIEQKFFSDFPFLFFSVCQRQANNTYDIMK